MKRIQEKVKDLIEVRKFKNLRDFISDPAETLAGYHFTDATAELMVKWLDRVGSLQSGQGIACALAGYRGVGKSHFIAAFGGMVALPELRNKISDSHVNSAAQSLLRRRYPVVYVRRGTEDTLIEEFRSGLANSFGLEMGSVPATILDSFTAAKARAGDMPILVLVDTAMERSARVSRDDGAILAEIAEVATATNSFLAVALDDDISSADGTNSAIVRAFTIDYLDQDHLYKVVDNYVFPKNNQFRPVLHDTYEYFRAVIPSFRWSEQKFTSLYPLHPVILEVAPFVRLFVHDFALLGFASEAGERILGRPANSLIALDEVFDSAEKGLRKIEDLHEAFSAYDRLNSEVVAKIPVMQRLQAKLILKALLLLSLDGQGTTAAEITAGMLIFDEKETQKAAKIVEELVRTFAAALPEDVRVVSEEGREVRYSLKVRSKDKLNEALDEAARKLSTEIVQSLLHRLFHERFSDSSFFSLDGSRKTSMDCQLTWRGGIRRGRVCWGETNTEQPEGVDGDLHDWEAVIDLDGDLEQDISQGKLQRVVWRPAELQKDEIEVLIRYHVLNSDRELREKFGEEIRASLHSYGQKAIRIANRVFLEDSRLIIDKFDYNFTEEARNSQLLSEIFSLMLEPLFELRFPQHPFFLRRLGMGEVATLVSDLYSGSRHQLAEVQQLAQTFALPLGIVKLQDRLYVSESADKLGLIPAVSTVIDLASSFGTEGASVQTIYAELKKPPFGYVREAQQLILAAMVSQRMIEFVTSKGDRINQRSLDLKIIWDDIVGVAVPQETAISSKKLLRWAEVLSGNREFKSFSNTENCKVLTESMNEWVRLWDEACTLEKFNEIPVEEINSRMYRKAAVVGNTLGKAISAFKQHKDGALGLQESLAFVSEAFLDEPSLFDKVQSDLKTIDVFARTFAEITTIKSYVMMTEATEIDEIENNRERLLVLLDELSSSPTEERSRELGYAWARFKRAFVEYYVSEHDNVMRSHELQVHAEEIKRSDDWWEFQNLADLITDDNPLVKRIRVLENRLAELNCAADLKNLLETRPFCTCHFSIAKSKEWASLTHVLEELLKEVVGSIKAYLIENAEVIVPKIETMLETPQAGSVSDEIRSLISSLRSGSFKDRLTVPQVTILRKASKEVIGSQNFRSSIEPELVPFSSQSQSPSETESMIA